MLLSFPPQIVNRCKKRIAAVEVCLSGKPEPLRGIFGEAVEFVHFSVQRSKWVHETNIKSGLRRRRLALPILGLTRSPRYSLRESWHSIMKGREQKGIVIKPKYTIASTLLIIKKMISNH
jgi:hypothetical protein